MKYLLILLILNGCTFNESEKITEKTLDLMPYARYIDRQYNIVCYRNTYSGALSCVSLQEIKK